MKITNISKWKNKQSEPQATSSSIKRQPPSCKMLLVGALALSTLLKFCGKLLQLAS